MAKMSTDDLYALVRGHGAEPGVDRAMVAGALAESGGDPNAHGDFWNGAFHSWGLWQLNDDGGLGAGMTVEARTDPDTACSVMLPVYRRAFALASDVGYTDDDAVGAATCMEAERPFGYPDPNLVSAAAQNYRAHWNEAVPPDGEQAPPVSDDADCPLCRDRYMAALETHRGEPYNFGGKTPPYDCSGLLTDVGRQLGMDMGDPNYTSADALKLHATAIDWSEARKGDWVLFDHTYTQDNGMPFPSGYATHCGASYGAGTQRMFDTHGSPWPGAGETDIGTAYWQDHFIGVWRPHAFEHPSEGVPPPEDDDMADAALINKIGYLTGDVADAFERALDGLNAALGMAQKTKHDRAARQQAIADATSAMQAALNTLRAAA